MAEIVRQTTKFTVGQRKSMQKLAALNGCSDLSEYLRKLVARDAVEHGIHFPHDMNTHGGLRNPALMKGRSTAPKNRGE
jgi:hypothetical protein